MGRKKLGSSEGFRAAREKAKGIAEEVVNRQEPRWNPNEIATRIGEMEP